MNIRISEKQKILYYSAVTLYLTVTLCLTCVEIMETHRNKKPLFRKSSGAFYSQFCNNIHFSRMTGIVLFIIYVIT